MHCCNIKPGLRSWLVEFMGILRGHGNIGRAAAALKLDKLNP
jgi:hypothetical protein